VSTLPPCYACMHAWRHRTRVTAELCIATSCDRLVVRATCRRPSASLLLAHFTQALVLGLRVGVERRGAPAATDALTGARFATSPSPSAREHEIAVAPMYTPASFSLVKPLLAFLLPVSPLARHASCVAFDVCQRLCSLSSRPRSPFSG
jgi:hypothetical protein